MPQIVFATCNKKPALQLSDAVAAAALEKIGAEVIAAPWNGEQEIFKTADLIVVRSTWDYHYASEAFAEWLGSLDGGRVVNAPSLMRWNMSKRYLGELAGKGVVIPPFKIISPSIEEIAIAMDALDVEEAIVKPLIGATSSGLTHVRRGDAASLQAAADALKMEGLVQAFIPEVETVGETSLIFIDGEFTHAVTKRPQAGEIRVQAEFGGTAEWVSPPDWAVRMAGEILQILPEPAQYARIDAVILDETIQLMEVELIEPELFFTYCPEAADQFAAMLLKRIE